MDTIIALIFLLLAGVIIYRIYSYFAGKKMTSTDEYYQQNGVKVEYDKQTITIGKHTYPATHVTSIITEYNINGARDSQHIKIEVDDLVKPVHRVIVVGGRHSADQLSQRICVALRKAGGKSFS